VSERYAKETPSVIIRANPIFFFFFDRLCLPLLWLESPVHDEAYGAMAPGVQHLHGIIWSNRGNLHQRPHLLPWLGSNLGCLSGRTGYYVREVNAAAGKRPLHESVHTNAHHHREPQDSDIQSCSLLNSAIAFGVGFMVLLTRNIPDPSRHHHP